MRKTILTSSYFVFISCNSPSHLSNEKNEVRKVLLQFNDYLSKMNYERVYYMNYLSSFDSFTKEEVIADLQNSMHNDEYDFYLNKLYIDSISEVFVYNSNKYARADYRVNGSFHFKFKSGEDSLRKFKGYCQNHIDMYGGTNVRCDQKNKVLNLTSKDYALVIYSYRDRRWFILSSNGAKRIGNIIPPEIQSKLQY